MGSIFITYGAKAGGASYIWGDWSAYNSVSSGTSVTVGDPVEGAQEVQVQTRTRTGSTYSQKQTRTRTCNCGNQQVYGSYVVSMDFGQGYCPYGSCDCCSSCWNYYCWTGWCGPNINCLCSCANGIISYLWEQYETGWSTQYVCNWGGYSGWSNVSSCSTSSPGCNNGAVQRQCQTVTLCSFGDWTGWSDTSSCSATAPSCTNGAVQRECQSRTRSAVEV